MLNKTNLANAYTEILKVLENLSYEEYSKIPENVIEFFKDNCNNRYIFFYKPDKSLDEQDLLYETKLIMFTLFELYGTTPEEKIQISRLRNNKLYSNSSKFNTNEIFRNEKSNYSNHVNSELPLVVKERWYNKMFNYFSKFLSKLGVK